MPEQEKLKLIPHEVILVSDIPNCYFCEQEGTIKPGPYDFATAMGPWANGCEMHYHMYKATSSLGTGKGQLWVTKDQIESDPEPKPGTVGAILADKNRRNTIADDMEEWS